MNSQLLLQKVDQVNLREVRMKLNLVHDWFYFGIRPEINEQSYCAVADSDILNQASLNETLKLSPDLVKRSGKNLSVVNLGHHPVNKV